ncbi:MAG: hypothetical protein U1E36_05750 [Rickettsiales bacterium]
MSILGTAWNTVTAPIRGIFSGLATWSDVSTATLVPLMVVGGAVGLFFGPGAALVGVAGGALAAAGLGMVAGAGDAAISTTTNVASAVFGGSSEQTASAGEEQAVESGLPAKGKESGGRTV